MQVSLYVLASIFYSFERVANYKAPSQFEIITKICLVMILCVVCM